MMLPITSISNPQTLHPNTPKIPPVRLILETQKQDFSNEKLSAKIPGGGTYLYTRTIYAFPQNPLFDITIHPDVLNPLTNRALVSTANSVQLPHSPQTPTLESSEPFSWQTMYPSHNLFAFLGIQ